MARSTLFPLIERLRGLTQTTPTDWDLGTAHFWDNDQLQYILDRHRSDLYREQLERIPRHVGGGTVHYLEYRSAFLNLESTDGGTAIFEVEDSAGANVGTGSWTADYFRGVINFGSDQGGTVYYLTARSFDLNSAAAEVWRLKAGHYAATAFDFSTDNMRINRSQLVEHCQNMARQFESSAMATTSRVERGDSP